MAGYPEFEKFAYAFGRAELNANKKIWTLITSVQFDQPTTEGTVMGTRPWPLMRTEGNMGLGSGTVTFSEESERLGFLEGLGNGWRSKIWLLNWTLASPGRPTIKLACQGCRVLGNPFAHQQGDDALSGDVTFSFMSHTINGKTPHLGQVAPTR